MNTQNTHLCQPNERHICVPTPTELCLVLAGLLPSWVTECVLRGVFTEPAMGLKLSFFLVPCEGMQPISKAKLSAPRILRMHKVLTYVEQRLGLDDALQIVCNHVVVQPHMSLASVRQFVWKRTEDIELCYRLRPST